jgi:hypothetical protein
MPDRPSVVAFDVIGTLFPLDPLREPLVGLGLPPQALEVWFARTLRDGFALAASGAFRPFAEVATGTLVGLLAEHGRPDGPPDRLRQYPGRPGSCERHVGLPAGLRLLDPGEERFRLHARLVRRIDRGRGPRPAAGSGGAPDPDATGVRRTRPDRGDRRARDHPGAYLARGPAGGTVTGRL